MSEASTVQVRSAIEEQLGEIRQFADMPAKEIETIALRLTRSIEGFLRERCTVCGTEQRSAA
jgi:hypothetical protein